MLDADLSAMMLSQYDHLLYRLMVRVEAGLVSPAEVVRGASAALSMESVVIPHSAAVPDARRRTAYVLGIWYCCRWRLSQIYMQVPSKCHQMVYVVRHLGKHLAVS